MPLYMIRNDITKMNVDAIVNPTNHHLVGTGGTDGSIHRSAGPALRAELRALGGCKTGEAKLTGAGNLPCRYIIHTVGPRWTGGLWGEREKLVSCYRSSLELAREYHCETLAFPLIASGTFGCPKELALEIASETIREFLQEHDMTVYLVLFDRQAYRLGKKRFADITAYIDDNYAEAHSDGASSFLSPSPSRNLRSRQPEQAEIIYAAPDPFPGTLEEALGQIDESFSEMLLRKIDEKGMKDAECYKKANISRKLFSKIRSDRLYRPSKPTVLAFAIALELPLPETREMLEKAGFALSRSSKADIIVEYFIRRGHYNIYEINEALFAFDQKLLGGG